VGGRGRARRRWLGAAVVAALLAAAAIDLYGPRRSSLRDFDPAAVARLETDMWRSYYDRERGRLFIQLADLLRTQYRLPPLRSGVVAFHAAKAAFVFKDGRARADYERALPGLERYYAAIRRVSDEPFDPRRAARLELAWWIIHRERGRHAPGDLERALAELAAEMYQIPPERAWEHARFRAEAMTVRDERAASGGVTEADWSRIHDLLGASWGALRRELDAEPRTPRPDPL
jgi:hypothetical protein